MLDHADLRADLAAVAKPVAQARGLPNRCYVDPVVYAFEAERLLRGGWACVGVGADVPQPGDVRPIDFLGAPLLLARDRQGALRLFQNVCRHRGMILVDAPRNVGGVLRCPYHSWCYSLDGRLRATPHAGGPGNNDCEGLDRDATGLIPVRMGVFMGAVFADLSGQAPDFETVVAPLRARWAGVADQVSHHGGAESRFQLTVRCNWKLAVENYCESYHLPWVHPGLNSYSKLEDHYDIVAPGAFSGQGTRVYAPRLDAAVPPDFAGAGARWGGVGEYVALFPNALFGACRDHTFLLRLDPQGCDRTVEHVDIWFATEEAATSPAYAATRAEIAAQWRAVFEEDVGVVEGMQRGRNAPGFDGGRFAPAMDAATHAFHDWVARRLV